MPLRYLLNIFLRDVYMNTTKIRLIRIALLFMMPWCTSYADSLSSRINALFDHGLRDRLGVSFYVSDSSEITNKAELAAVAYDVNEDMSIVMGTSVTMPRQFHYVDVSWRNPWTLYSWQSSIELGIGRYFVDESLQSRISQSISFDYPLDRSYSLQLMMKRFTRALHSLTHDSNLFAMGLGMRI